jgi:hypothetical protein
MVVIFIKDLIPIINQSDIFVGNAARQGTPAHAWGVVGFLNVYTIRLVASISSLI